MTVATQHGSLFSSFSFSFGFTFLNSFNHARIAAPEEKGCSLLARKSNAFGSMKLHHAICFLWVLVCPLPIKAQNTCGISFISSCVVSAVSSVCGGTTQIECVCGTSAQSAIGSGVGTCLIQSCPLTQILAIATEAVGICNEWSLTHTLTGTQTGQGAAAATSFLPSSTSFSLTANASAGQMSITSSATLPTSTLGATTSPSLSTGAEVGIGVGVGAFVLLGVLTLGFVLCLRRRRSRRNYPASNASVSAHELQTTEPVYELPDKSQIHELETGANIQELQDKSDELEQEPVVGIPLQELAGFQFPFQKHPNPPIEADSRTARAGHPRGRQAGTEATVFDFENQKVLLTPNLRGTSKGSASPSRSLRQHNVEI